MLQSQAAAIKRIRPGVAAKAVDAAARQSLRRKGLLRRFTHGLGHGLGLEVHEGPGIGPRQKKPLRQGMVFTVEPGVYVQGKGGIRIEDVVMVTGAGCRVLTSVPKSVDDAIVR